MTVRRIIRSVPYGIEPRDDVHVAAWIMRVYVCASKRGKMNECWKPNERQLVNGGRSKQLCLGILSPKNANVLFLKQLVEL